MAKKARATAVYQTGEHDRIIFTVSIPASFPDCVDEVRCQAVRGVENILDSVTQPADTPE